MSNLSFRVMAVLSKLRDFVRPRAPILQEAGLQPGDHVLDFGCGPGSYTFLAAQQVGPEGKVYALDLQPLALETVQAEAAKRRLSNVETLVTVSRLPAASIDVILLYDIFHMLSQPEAILAELQRVLKPDGSLSFSDHHMNEADILTGMTRSALFKLSKKGERTFRFMIT